MKIVFWIIFCELAFSDLGVVKINELKVDIEPQIYYHDGHLFVWADPELFIVRNNQIILTKKIRNGQGPGEISIFSGMICTKNGYLLWDRRQRRLSEFSKNWQFVSLKNLPDIRNGLLVGTANGDLLFKLWKREAGNIQTVADTLEILRGDRLVPLAKASGVLMLPNGNVNYERPVLMSAFANEIFYHGENLVYTIQASKLIEGNLEVIFGINGKSRRMKWRENELIRNLFLEYRASGPDDAHANEAAYKMLPEYAPPLFTLIADGDLLGVVTNHFLGLRQTRIDLWKEKQLLGSVSIPLIFSQTEIMFTLRLFPEGIYLEGRKIHALHYDIDEGHWLVTTWKIEI